MSLTKPIGVSKRAKISTAEKTTCVPVGGGLAVGGNLSIKKVREAFFIAKQTPRAVPI